MVFADNVATTSPLPTAVWLSVSSIQRQVATRKAAGRVSGVVRGTVFDLHDDLGTILDERIYKSIVDKYKQQMSTTNRPSSPQQFVISLVSLVVFSLILVLGGTQSGIVTPTFTWATVVLILTGICSGLVFWKYSLEPGDGLLLIQGYRLALYLVAILALGTLWVLFVPSTYGSDLVFGVLAMAWTVFIATFSMWR